MRDVVVFGVEDYALKWTEIKENKVQIHTEITLVLKYFLIEELILTVLVTNYL